MPKNTIKQTVIGYYDEDGHAYCLKHGRPGMEEIIETTFEKCCICEVWIDTE